MNEAEQIRRALRKLTEDGERLNYYAIIARVKSVDEEARTCDVEPIDGTAEIFDVRLNASIDNVDGITTIPEVDSIVMVAMINANAGVAFMYEKVKKYLFNAEEISFNDGNNDGLVLVKELTKKLNNLETNFNKLLLNFSTHIHVDPVSGTTGTITVPPTAQGLTPTSKAEIENKKIKH